MKAANSLSDSLQCGTTAGLVVIIPEDTPENWKKAVEKYEPFFRVYKKYGGDIVTGDTGIISQYSALPWNCFDIITYMGGSIPLAIGASLAGRKNVWAVTGDFSFIATGPLALLEAKLRNPPCEFPGYRIKPATRSLF
ncbi:MAG: hypothetical protein ISS17_01355 [Bacteroidales bacterium]|nr:hypothetical protein [Bacteroidales bacterium]